MNQQYENQVDGLRRGVGENGEDQDGDLETDSDFVDDSDMMANIEPNLRTLPDKYLGQIIHVLQNLPNETVDIGTPHLRKSLEDVYPLFLVLYGVVMVAGALGNIGMAGHILRRRLYRDSTGAYLLNIAFCNVLMVVVLLPLSLAILLIQNWVFGSFLCYFVPMLQDVPLHVTMGTLLAVAAARYRRVMTPDKPPLPPFPTVLATWVLGVCIVLPYALYMHYIDFEVFLGPQFAGVGICTVNLEDDVTEYIHCLFIILFVLPLGVVAFLQVRVGVALAALGDAAPPPTPPRPRDLPPPDPHPRVWNLHPSDHVFSSIRNEGRNRSICTEHLQMSTFLPLGAEVGGCGGGGEERGQLGTSTPSSPQLVQNGGGGAAVEAARERTDQRYLVALVIFFAVCVCPLMVLRLVKNMIDETEQNAAHFDLAFVTAVWVAFLPTITTPALYTAWRMGSPFKNRLLSHLRPCPWERRQRYPPTPTHEMPPMFNSAHPAHANHAHAAHRLSLQHSLLPPSPRPHHAHAHPSSSHALRKDLVLHRQQQFPVERVSFSS